MTETKSQNLVEQAEATAKEMREGYRQVIPANDDLPEHEIVVEQPEVADLLEAIVAELRKKDAERDCGAKVATCNPLCLEHARSEAERFHNQARQAEDEADELRQELTSLEARRQVKP